MIDYSEGRYVGKRGDGNGSMDSPALWVGPMFKVRTAIAGQSIVAGVDWKRRGYTAFVVRDENDGVVENPILWIEGVVKKKSPQKNGPTPPAVSYRGFYQLRHPRRLNEKSDGPVLAVSVGSIRYQKEDGVRVLRVDIPEHLLHPMPPEFCGDEE